MTNLASYRWEQYSLYNIRSPIPWVPEVFSRVPRRASSATGARPTHLDRNRKPRMKSLWQAGQVTWVQKFGRIEKTGWPYYRGGVNFHDLRVQNTPYITFALRFLNDNRMKTLRTVIIKTTVYNPFLSLEIGHYTVKTRFKIVLQSKNNERTGLANEVNGIDKPSILIF